MTWILLPMGLLFGFALGFKLHEVISRPVIAEYDRMLEREARRQLRGQHE